MNGSCSSAGGRGNKKQTPFILNNKSKNCSLGYLRTCSYWELQMLPFLNSSAQILLTLEEIWDCFHVREVFLNNFPDVSGLSKFSINFRQSSFPTCCFSSFSAHLLKCSFYNRNLLFRSRLPYICFIIDLSSDTV